MNRYEKGQIYKIVDVGYNKMYIGSTTEPLSKRMERHRHFYDRYRKGLSNFVTSYYIFNEFGVENCKIEWIGDFPCNSRKELEAEEGNHIRRNDCVNKKIAGRTPHQYNIENYKDNKTKINEKNKKHYEQNREATNERHRKNYWANRDKVLANQAQKITCSCGSIHRKGDKTKHERTKKHQDWLKQQEE